MRQRLQWMMVVALLLAGLFAMPPAYAQTAPAPAATAAAPAATPVVSECSKYPGVANRIAGCVRESIMNLTGSFFGEDRNGDGKPDTGFYPLVRMMIAGFMTLAIAIYGVMFAAGMIERAGRDSLVLAIKLAMIGFFTQSTPMMYDYAITAMDSLAATVVQVTPRNGIADGTGGSTDDFGKITCLKVMTSKSEAAGKPVVGPWLAMDCLLDTVIGIKINPNAGYNTDTGTSSTGGIHQAASDGVNKVLKGDGLERGMIYFFFSGMKTSVIGLILGILGFIFIWGIISAIIKALMIYIAGYIGVTFMMIISPIFIPLVMFRATKEYFDKWVKLTISFALQPILVLLFVSLSISAIDLALQGTNYSVMYRIAGDKSRNANFNINQYLKDAGAITNKPVALYYQKFQTDVLPTVTDASKRNEVMSGLRRLVKCPNGTTIDAKSLAKGGDPCQESIAIQNWRETIDWEKLAKARQPQVVLDADANSGATSAGMSEDAKKGRQITREILSACIFLGVVIFIMNKLMTVVPYIVTDLVGDFGQTPNLGNAMTSQWNSAAQGAAAKGESTIRGGFDGMLNRLGGRS